MKLWGNVASRSAKENDSVTCLGKPSSANQTLCRMELATRENLSPLAFPPHSAETARFRAAVLASDATHHKHAERRDHASTYFERALFVQLQFL